MTGTITETCGCGARIDLPNILPTWIAQQCAAFREAHRECRTAAASYQRGRQDLAREQLALAKEIRAKHEQATA